MWEDDPEERTPREGGTRILGIRKCRKGFTLIELMVVVAVIGILAVIALTNYLKVQAKSKQTEAKTNFGAICSAQLSYFGEKNAYGDFTQINWSPTGAPRYHYQLGAWNLGGDNVNAGNSIAGLTQASWAGNLNGATDNGALVSGTLTPGINNGAVPPAFIAGASGRIGSGATVDGWVINQRRILVWTADGT